MPADYLLHESSVGFAVFKVVHQVDTVGNRLKENQDSVKVRTRFSSTSRSQLTFQGLSKIWEAGTAGLLCAFPVRLDPVFIVAAHTFTNTEEQRRPWRMSTTSPKEL